MSKYTVEIITPNGLRIAKPFGVEALTKTEELDIDNIFFTQTNIKGSLDFRDEDFHHLYDWERSNRRCNKATLIIRELCSTTKEVFRILINPDDLDINPDRCSAILQVDIKTTIYQRYNEFKGIEYNLFELFDSRVIWHVNNEGVVDPIFFQVQNGMLLRDVISALLNKAYPGIDLRSSFFGWGEPQGATIGHSDLLTKMIIAQTSDIYKRQLHTYDPMPDPATVLKSSLESILGGLCGMFNLKCDIENNNIFRIEHVSFFDTITGPYNDARIGNSGRLNNKLLKKYEHNNSNYSIETFSSRSITEWLDFAGMPIEYDTCNSKTDAENKITVPFCLDLYPGITSSAEDNLLNNMFLGALDPTTDTLQELPPILDTYVVSGRFVNNLLGWAYLATDYHRSNKSFSVAKINGEWTTVEQKMFKVQRGVKIYSCCNDASIINGIVETDIGEGRVMNTSKQFGKSYIEADVYFHDVPEVSIAIPTAVNDWYYSLVDEVINTSTSGRPSLIANDSGTAALSIIAETKSTIGGGSVTILTTGHFIYTPQAGFDGVDEFDYFLKDGNGNIATGTAFIGIRIPVVYIHKTEVAEPIGPTIAVTTDFEYFRDAGMLYPYDTTNMDLEVFINAYDVSLVNVYNYSFIASGTKQRVPGAVGETDGITEYTKDIQADSNYLQV